MGIRHALREFHALRAALWALLLLSSASSSLAFESIAGDPIFDRFNISIGTFFYGSGTNITLNGAFTRGVPVDLEHQLGFQGVNRFRIDGYWRITTHQRLRFTYFDASRHSTKTITETLHYGDTTFPFGATVSAHNKVTVGELLYEYDFFVRRNWSLGASLGIHNINFGLRVSANSTTPTSSQTQVSLNQDASADGPMPMVGLAGIWRPESWLYFTLGAQALKVTINPYSGTLQNYGISAVWQPTKHFGVGAGYDYFRMNTSVSKVSFNGELAWRYSGARVFLSGSF